MIGSSILYFVATLFITKIISSPLIITPGSDSGFMSHFVAGKNMPFASLALVHLHLLYFDSFITESANPAPARSTEL
ncbi:MAG: hypothetical protein QXV32_07880 [Conexivisphaerales archaeon]